MSIAKVPITSACCRLKRGASIPAQKEETLHVYHIFFGNY